MDTAANLGPRITPAANTPRWAQTDVKEPLLPSAPVALPRPRSAREIRTPAPGRAWSGSWSDGKAGLSAAMLSCSRRGAGALRPPFFVGVTAALWGCVCSRHSGTQAAAGASALRAAGKPGRAAEAPCAPRLHSQSLEAPRWLVTTGWSKRGGRRQPRKPPGMLGWLAGCPGRGPGSASREAVSNSEPALPSARGAGAPRVPPAARCPACWLASPALPQLLPPAASSPGAPPAGDTAMAKKASAEGPAAEPGTLAVPKQQTVSGRAGDRLHSLHDSPGAVLPAAGVGQGAVPGHTSPVPRSGQLEESRGSRREGRV